jgi:hypothetical protein
MALMILAWCALSPSSPRTASGGPLRALGLDRSASIQAKAAIMPINAEMNPSDTLWIPNTGPAHDPVVGTPCYAAGASGDLVSQIGLGNIWSVPFEKPGPIVTLQRC